MGCCGGEKDLSVCSKSEGLGEWDVVEGRKIFLSAASLKAWVSGMLWRGERSFCLQQV